MQSSISLLLREKTSTIAALCTPWEKRESVQVITLSDDFIFVAGRMVRSTTPRFRKAIKTARVIISFGRAAQATRWRDNFYTNTFVSCAQQCGCIADYYFARPPHTRVDLSRVSLLPANSGSKQAEVFWMGSAGPTWQFSWCCLDRWNNCSAAISQVILLPYKAGEPPCLKPDRNTWWRSMFGLKSVGMAQQTSAYLREEWMRVFMFKSSRIHFSQAYSETILVTIGSCKITTQNIPHHLHGRFSKTMESTGGEHHLKVRMLTPLKTCGMSWRWVLGLLFVWC